MVSLCRLIVWIWDVSYRRMVGMLAFSVAHCIQQINQTCTLQELLVFHHRSYKFCSLIADLESIMPVRHSAEAGSPDPERLLSSKVAAANN